MDIRIIRIKGNELSERMAFITKELCTLHGQEAAYFDAVVPETKWDHVKRMGIPKVASSQLSESEQACAVSHMSLWYELIQNEQDNIVVLEHDAIILRPIPDIQIDYPCYVQLNTNGMLLTPPDRYGVEYKYEAPVYFTTFQSFKFNNIEIMLSCTHLLSSAAFVRAGG